MDNESKLKVLIIDDEPDTIDLFSTLLKRKIKASSESAVDCASARRILSSSSFDLVMLDYRLPDGDGIELLREIGAMDNPPPVIMVTGHGDEKTAIDALRYGVAGYVTKDPMMSVTLVEEIESALALRSLERAEKALKLSEEKYHQIFENMKSGVAVYRPANEGRDFIIVDFNKAAETIESINRRDVIGRSVLEVFPGIKELGLFGVLQEVWRKGEPVRLPVALYSDERIAGWRDNYVYKLPNGEIVTIYQDLTELKETEKLFESVIEEFPGSVLIISGAGKVVYTNKATAGLLGADFPKGGDLEKLREDYFEAYIAGTDQLYPLKQAPTTRAFRGERTTVDDIEIEIDGARKHLEVTTVPILGIRGDIKYVVIWSRDITERKRAEGELIGSESRLRELYDSSVEGIGVVDVDGRLEYVNPSLAEMLGYKNAEELLGMKAANVYANPDERRELMKILLEQGALRNFEVTLKRKDGSCFWAMANVNVYRDEGEKHFRTAAFLTDITERKQAEEELKRVNRELDAYAHTISHDLKGPLSAIGIAVNLVDPDTVQIRDEDTEEVLEIIRRNTAIAHRRVESILKLAEWGQRPTEVEEVDVGEVVGEVLEIMSFQVEAKGITLHVDKEMGKVRANLPQIEQLFSNLISNAIKHNNNTVDPEIRIAYLGDEGGAHRYLVKDNGEGINSSQLDRLFDPFKKGGKTGEVGLGLSIVRKIITVYGGDIRAYNDNGACFEFLLRDYILPGGNPD